jgi:uncharacterized membrane protein YdjX (TVP38/TMEM64 family)
MSRNRFRLLLVGVLAVGFLFAVCRLPALDGLEGQLQDWRTQLGLWGLVLLAVLFTPLCLVLIPASILMLLAGYFYDVPPAAAAVSLGATVAAGVIFLVGKTAARGWVEARFGRHPYFLALDQAIAENGFRIVLLTRLSPFFPFIFLNYAFSLTRVKFRAYLLGTFLGMLPTVALWVYLGSTIKDLGQLLQGRVAGHLGHTILTVIGLLATLAVTVLVTGMARRALRQVLRAGQPEPIPIRIPVAEPQPEPAKELAKTSS